MRKLDVFNHFFPDRYFKKMMDVAPTHKDMGKRIRNIPELHDLDARFRVMDQFDDYQQILSMPSPPIEVMAGPHVRRPIWHGSATTDLPISSGDIPIAFQASWRRCP